MEYTELSSTRSSASVIADIISVVSTRKQFIKPTNKKRIVYLAFSIHF